MRIEIDIPDDDLRAMAGWSRFKADTTLNRVIAQLIPIAKDWVADTELWEQQAARHAETLAALRDLKAQLDRIGEAAIRPKERLSATASAKRALDDAIAAQRPHPNYVTVEDTAALLRDERDDLRVENERLRTELVASQWAALKAERVELNLRHLQAAIRIHRAATDDHSHTPVNRELWAVLEEIPDV